MNKEISSELPEGWNVKPFTKCFKNISPGNKKIKRRDYLEDGKIPVIDQGEGFIGGYTNETSKKQDIDLPIIIFGDHTRRFKYVNQSFAVGADGTKMLKANTDFLDDKFAYYQCLQLELPHKGYSRHFQFLKKVDIRYPESKEEQSIIVQEIEKQFTHLDAAVKFLKSVKSKLEIYRKSVLKAAFEGKLCSVYSELTDVEDEWVESDIKSVAKVRYGKGLPKNVRSENGKISVYGSAGELGKHNEYLIEFPTIIVARKGSVGNNFIVKEPCWPIDTVYYLENITIDLDYLYYVLNFSTFKDTSTAVPSLRRVDLEAIKIRYPKSEEEQTQIVSEIESRFSVIDKLEETVDNALLKAEQLRKSILKSAFEGELVKYNGGGGNE